MIVKVVGKCDVYSEYDLVDLTEYLVNRFNIALDDVGSDFAVYYKDGSDAMQSTAEFSLGSDGNLYITVTYTDVPDSVSITALKEYTVGQWSDGIGEGFEQQPISVDGNTYYVSMWYRGQTVNVSTC